MMQTDVKAAHTTGSGVIYAGPTRVKGLAILGSSAGDVVLYDNASAGSGTVLMTLGVPGNSNNVVNILIPGEGVKAVNGVYATTPTGVSVTVFYG